MNDNYIHVRITKGEGAEGIQKSGQPTSETSFTPSPQPKSPNDGKISGIKTGAINTALINLGKQAMSYGLSNYGDLTGDHIGQTRINEGLEVAGLIGMAASGWVGAAAALGSVAVKAVNRYVDIKKSEITSNALRIRTGGSRR